VEVGSTTWSISPGSQPLYVLLRLTTYSDGQHKEVDLVEVLYRNHYPAKDCHDKSQHLIVNRGVAPLHRSLLSAAGRSLGKVDEQHPLDPVNVPDVSKMFNAEILVRNKHTRKLGTDLSGS
jgi:hypothetical protein